MDLSQASQVYVSDGTNWLPADQVVAGTGSSTRIVWSSVVKLTGTTPYQSRDQLRAALAERGFDYRTITSIPFELDLSGATEAEGLFSGMAELEAIQEIDVSRFDSILRMFEGATSLTDAPLVGVSSSVDFSETSLSPDSANEIMRGAGSVSPRTNELLFPGASAGCDPTLAEDKGWLVPAIPGTVYHYTTSGTRSGEVPEWARYVDMILVGGGGGGASGGRLAGNGNGGQSGRVVADMMQVTPGEEWSAYAGPGGEGGATNSNASGSRGMNATLFSKIATGGSGGSGTGGSAGGGTTIPNVFSASLSGALTAGTNVDGRTPGGGGGGGDTGGLIGGGGRPGRKGGDGMTWFRFRGDGS